MGSALRYKNREIEKMVWKIVFLVFFILITSQVAGASTSWGDRYSSEYASDYFGHYAVGAAIGASVMYYTPDKWNLSTWQKVALSIAVPMLVKTAFEVFDDYPDYRDVVEFGMGGAAGGLTVVLFTFTF